MGVSLSRASSSDSAKNWRYSSRVPGHPLPLQLTVQPTRPSGAVRRSTRMRDSGIVQASMDRDPSAASAMTVLRTMNANPAATSASTCDAVHESCPEAFPKGWGIVRPPYLAVRSTLSSSRTTAERSGGGCPRVRSNNVSARRFQSLETAGLSGSVITGRAAPEQPAPPCLVPRERGPARTDPSLPSR